MQLKQRGAGASGAKPETIRRELVMHNKAPMWNESSQVYQLDFGGRVTQESAKNFQIEFRGRQVRREAKVRVRVYEREMNTAPLKSHLIKSHVKRLIELLTAQVMQFGRIDGNAYTLDFQYPFSALQAFAVALANVTQRLK